MIVDTAELRNCDGRWGGVGGGRGRDRVPLCTDSVTSAGSFLRVCRLPEAALRRTQTQTPNPHTPASRRPPGRGTASAPAIAPPGCACGAARTGSAPGSTTRGSGEVEGEGEGEGSRRARQVFRPTINLGRLGGQLPAPRVRGRAGVPAGVPSYRGSAEARQVPQPQTPAARPLPPCQPRPHARRAMLITRIPSTLRACEEYIRTSRPAWPKQ
jgi:hypothetical protein